MNPRRLHRATICSITFAVGAFGDGFGAVGSDMVVTYQKKRRSTRLRRCGSISDLSVARSAFRGRGFATLACWLFRGGGLSSAGDHRIQTKLQTAALAPGGVLVDRVLRRDLVEPAHGLVQLFLRL